jgi:hypothetical protein
MGCRGEIPAPAACQCSERSFFIGDILNYLEAGRTDRIKKIKTGRFERAGKTSSSEKSHHSLRNFFDGSSHDYSYH